MADMSPDDSDIPPGAISVALSPIQLAAIIGSASISQSETWSNRIWGGVGLVGGALELLGSAALLVDPDPTVSKVVGVVGLVHGSDVTMTSWNQLRTGEAQQTMTSQAASALAESAGMNPRAAGITGAIVGIIVPTGILSELGRANSLARLTRVTRIRTGFISLDNEEQAFNFSNRPSQSAHTLREHVGKTLEQMEARFSIKPSLEATGSFRDLPTAEKAVSDVLQSQARRINAWVAGSASRPLRLSMKMAEDVGEGVLNPAKNAVTPGLVHVGLRVRTVTVVLNKTTLQGRTWYVLSAFPDIMRDIGRWPM